MSNCPDQQFIRATAWFLLHVSFASGSGVTGDGHHGWRACQLSEVGDVICSEPWHRGTAQPDPAGLPLPQGHLLSAGPAGDQGFSWGASVPAPRDSLCSPLAGFLDWNSSPVSRRRTRVARAASVLGLLCSLLPGPSPSGSESVAWPRRGQG